MYLAAPKEFTALQLKLRHYRRPGTEDPLTGADSVDRRCRPRETLGRAGGSEDAEADRPPRDGQ
jgi:hypothetical protein